jgi:hypothetical protein
MFVKMDALNASRLSIFLNAISILQPLSPVSLESATASSIDHVANDVLYYLTDGLKATFHHPLMPVAAKQMLYVSGTNFLPVPGNYYYAGREGTYKLKTKLHNGQPKLWGDFHPTGSSNFKYSHYITVCAAQNSFDLVTQQIFSSMFTINENLDKCCRHGVGLSTVMNKEPCRNVFNKMGSSIVAFGETICGI